MQRNLFFLFSCFLLSGVNLLSGQSIITDNLEIHLDPGNPSSYSGSGSTLTDLAGNTNNGTIVGNPSVNQNSLDLDGSDDYIFVGNGFTNPQTFSIEVWVKTTDTGVKIMGFEDKTAATASGSYDRHLYVDTSGNAVFGIFDGTTTIVTGSSINDGNWHHLAGTFNGGTKTAILYVDGVYQNEITTAGDAQSYSGFWRIGSYKLTAWPSSADGFLDGEIGAARVYNDVLSSAEITNNFNADRTNYYGVTVVSSGGDAEGTTWSTSSNNITPSSGNARINASDIAAKLNAGDLTITSSSILIQADITKTSGGEATLTLKSTGKINSNGYTISSTSNKLNVLFWVESDGGTSLGAALGAITTNGGHLWVGGGSGTQTWNGLSIGDGLSMSDGTNNWFGMDLHGDITTSGGDIYLAADDGHSTSPSIGGINSVNLFAGAGDISFIVRDASTFENSTNFISIKTTGNFTIAPPSNEDWVSNVTWDGSFSSSTFTGTDSMLGLKIIDFPTLGGFSYGRYEGTGVSGDTAYVASNTQNITLDEAISIAGPISFRGGDIALNANLTTTVAGADILIKANEGITTNASRNITTNNGDLIFWSDANASGSGNIITGDNNIYNTANGSTANGLTGGGNIILSGGLDNGDNSGTANDGYPDGYATTNSNYGLSIGTTDASASRFYSGGGGIVLRGSSDNSNSSGNRIGVFQFGDFLANAGNGEIVIYGESTHFYGINFLNSATSYNTLELRSNKSSGAAITINGESSASYGVVFNYNQLKKILATGGGDITITGTGAGSDYGIFLQDVDVLATSGTIRLDGGVKGIYSTDRGVRIGSKSGSEITSSSASVDLIGDVLNFSSPSSGFETSLFTTGALTAKSFSDSFTNALTYPVSNLDIGNSITALTVGTVSNTADITVGSDISIAGPITINGGNLTLSDNLSSSSSDGNISLQAKEHITNTALVNITTSGGDVLFAANVDDLTDNDTTENGRIDFRYGLSINSGGGDITLGGGNTLGTGYALGKNSVPEGIRIDTTFSLDSGGGNIALRGKSFAKNAGSGEGAWGVGFFSITSGTVINAGLGTVYIDGYSQSSNSTYSAGIYTHNSFSVISSNTTSDAIKLIAKATGSGLDAYALEANGPFNLYATGGGDISILSSTQYGYDIVFRDPVEILAHAGTINLIGHRDSGISNGYGIFLGESNANTYLGSKSGSTYVSSSSTNLNISYNNYTFIYLPKVATNGVVTFKSTSDSFGADVSTAWFDWNQNSHIMTGFTVGTTSNTMRVIHQTNALQVEGDIVFNGGSILVEEDLQATNGSIRLDADTGSALSTGNDGIKIDGARIETITSGDITLLGRSGDGNNSGLIGVRSSNTTNQIISAGNLTINGTSESTHSNGTGGLWLKGSIRTGGDVSITGKAVSANDYDVSFQDLSITAGGDITLDAQNGGRINLTGSMSIGAVGNQAYYADNLVDSGSTTVTGTGSFTYLADTDNTTFSTAIDLSPISFGTNFTAFTVGNAQNTQNLTLGSLDIQGPISLYGGDIVLSENISSTSSGASITLKATKDINLSANKSISSNNGDVVLWANSDGESENGAVILRDSSDITTNGGHLWVGGGSGTTTWNGITVGDGHAVSGTSISPSNGGSASKSGVYLENFTATTNGGNITLKGKSENTYYGFLTHQDITLDAGVGKINIEGIATGSGSRGGVTGFHDDSAVFTINSASNASDAITVNFDTTSGTFHGATLAGRINLIATNGGGIVFTSLGDANDYGLRLGYSTSDKGELNLLSNTGTITVDFGDRGYKVESNNASALNFGAKTGSAITTSSSNIIWKSDRFTLGSNPASNALNFNTSGVVKIIPKSNSFSEAFSTSAKWNFDTSLGGLTIGTSTNSANITIGDAISIAGPLTVSGGDIVLSNPLTTTDTLTLQSSGAVTQSQAVSATTLALLGSGSFTLSNSSNDVNRLTAGTSNQSIGTLNYTDSNALNLVSEGINSSGTVEVETLSGNLTLSQKVATTNTSNAAIKLYADKDATTPNAGDGNIIITGSATVTTGSGGRASLYSGSPASSTGLEALVGNDNIRIGVDQNTTSFSPALSNGVYALFRTGAEITFAENFTPFAFSSGLSSDPQTMVVSATQLTANVSISAPTGFELSLDGSAYTDSLSLSNTSGSLAETNVYVRVKSSASGNPSGTVTMTTTGGISKTVAVKAASKAALHFDGVDDYIELDGATFADFSGTQSFSLQAFIYPTSISGIQHILSKWKSADANSQWHIFIDNGYLNLFREVSPYNYATASKQISPNKWYQITVSYDGTTMSVYVDSELLGTNTSGSVATPNNLKVLIGAHYTSGSTKTNFFNGKMDEIRFWNKALTQEEIELQFYEKLEGNETGLIAYYDFNDGIPAQDNTGNTTLTDLTNTAEGTLNNFGLGNGNSSTWVDNPFPEGSLVSGYSNMPVALWSESGTNDTRDSNGLHMAMGAQLTADNYINFASSANTGTSTLDVPTTDKLRSNRIWYVNETGSVTATVKVGVASATGKLASDYANPTFSLLYRAGTSGGFTQSQTGTLWGDVVTFTAEALATGYYALGIVQNVTLTPSSTLSKTFGGTDPVLSYTTSPSVNLTGALARTVGENSGTYSITIGTVTSTEYNITFVNENFEITKATPTIEFSDIVKTYGDTDFTLTATSSNTNAFSFAIANASVATLSGSTVSIIGAGSTVITATQAASSNYTAGVATMTLTVNDSNSGLILLYDPNNVNSYSGSGSTINDLSSNGLNGTLSNLTYTAPYFNYNGSNAQIQIVDNELIEPNDNDFSFEIWVRFDSLKNSVILGKFDGGNSSNIGYALRMNPSGEVRLDVSNGSTHTSTQEFQASINNWYHFVGVIDDSNDLLKLYNDGTAFDNSTSFTSNVKNTATDLYLGSYNGGQFSQNMDGDIGLFRLYDRALSANDVLQHYNQTRLTYAEFATIQDQFYTGSAITVTPTLTFNGATLTQGTDYTTSYLNNVNLGTASLTITGMGSYVSSRTTSFSIVKKNPTIIFTDLSKNFGDADFNLSATSSSTGVFSYAITDGTVATVTGSTTTIVGAGSTLVTVTQAADAYNNSAVATMTLTVNTIRPAISFDDITKNFDDADFNLSATSSSTGAFSFAIADGNIATVTGSTTTIVGAGSTLVTLTQAADDNYNSAVATMTLTVNKISPAISFDDVTKNFGDTDFNLSTTSSSTGALSYAIADGNIATVTGSTTTIVGAGSTIVTLTQAADDNYNSAVATMTLTVIQNTAPINFSDITKTFGASDFALSATSSSTGAYTYTIADTSIATLAGNTVSIAAVGSSLVTVTQAADANYLGGIATMTLTIGRADINPTGSTTSLFTATGSTSWTAPFSISSVEYLVVGGGGGGGGGYDTGAAGGGGGGMVLSGTLSVTPGSTYTVVTGNGGAASTNNYGVTYETDGGDGENSSFASIVALGGTKGLRSRNVPNSAGLAGNAQNGNSSAATGGSGGGNASSSSRGSGGGGGGASSAGSNGTSSSGGAGGAGISSSITGSSITYGVGGNGARGNRATTGTSGAANTGNGGNGGGHGGSGARNGGAGGSGVVVLKYTSSGYVINVTPIPDQIYTGVPVTVSPTVTYNGVTLIEDNDFSASFTNNTNAGTASITLTGIGNYAGSKTVSFTILKANPTILFADVNKRFDDANFNLTATSSSTGAFSYAIADGNIATVTGSTTTIVGAGSTLVTLTQAADANYNSVVATMTLTVNKISPAISFADVTKNFDDADFNLSATSSGTGAFSYAIADGNIATVTGSTTTIVGAGSTIVTLTQAADDNYNSAVATMTLTVNTISPAISFDDISKNFDDADFNLSATSSSTGAFSFAIADGNIATVTGSTTTIVGAGSTIVTLTQAADDNYNSAVATMTLTVNKIRPAISFDDITKNFDDADFNLSATSSSTGAFSFAIGDGNIATVTGSTTTIVGAGSTLVTVTQAADANYNSAVATMTLTINKIRPAINFDDISKDFDDADFNLSATSSSTGAFSFAIADGNIATVTGSTTTIVGAGSTLVTVTQAADNNYNSALATMTLIIGKATPVIVFNDVTKNSQDAAFNLTATSSSTGAFSYSMTDGTVATVTGSTTTIVGVGSTLVTLTQVADDNYNSAVATMTLTVNDSNSGLILYFDPNNVNSYSGSGSTINDLSPNSLDGTLSNLSHNGSSFAFNGNDSQIRINDTGLLEPENTDYSFEVWVRFDVLQNSVILGKFNDGGGGGDIGYALRLDGNSQVRLNVGKGTSAANTQRFTAATNVWYHVVGAIDSSNDQLILYKDGAVFDNTTAFTSSVKNTSNPLYIGRYNGGEYAQNIDGDIGIVRIYNRALSTSDVLQNYNQTKFNYAELSSIPDQIYTGSAITVSPTLSFNGAALTEGVDYTSSYSNNTNPGTVSLTITGIGSYVGSKTTQFSITKANPNLGFDDLNKTYGDTDFNLSATSSSTGAFSFTVGDAAIATITGSTTTIQGAGSTIVTLTQAEDSYYAAAVATMTLSVNPANIAQSSVSSISNQTYTANAITLSPTVDFNGTTLTEGTDFTTSFGANTSVGTAIVTLTGSGNFTGSKTVSFTIVKANPSITFNDITKTFGDSYFDLTATSSSTGAFSFAIADATIATVTGSTTTIVGAGSTLVTLTQAANNNYNSTVATMTLTVNKATPIIVFDDVSKNFADADFTLTATSSSTAALRYAIADGSVATVTGSTTTIIGVGTTLVTVTQAANNNYNAAVATMTLSIGKIDPTITGFDPIVKTYGDPTFELVLPTTNSNYTGSFSFTSSDTTIASISGNTVTILQSGVVTLTASLSGDNNYQSKAVTTTLTINKASQVITISGLPQSQALKDFASIPLSAVSSSGAPVIITLAPGSSATLSGTIGNYALVSIQQTGIVSITFTTDDTANPNYTTATTTASFDVVKTNQTISFNNEPSSQISYTNSLTLDLEATSSAGLTVSYTLISGTNASLNGNTLLVNNTGPIIVELTQAGNVSYNAAPTLRKVITIVQGQTTLSNFSAISKLIDDGPFTLSPPTSNRSGSFSYTIANSNVATITGTLITITGIGNTTITATQNATTNFGAGSITAAFRVQLGDSDGDGIIDANDNCPSTRNANQLDTDGDGIGDVCDNAPTIPNADQNDTDGDGIGDAIDTDDDNDGVLDDQDAFPNNPNENSDLDQDGTGDNADLDDDNDGHVDTEDNCPRVANTDQLDSDGDGVGDVCDNAPTIPNADQNDTDADGIPDVLDTDDDNDGVDDEADAFPIDPFENTDTDQDGTGDNADLDDDNDGRLDTEDNCPMVANTDQLDTDGDGLGDVCDIDANGNEIDDVYEVLCGENPLDTDSDNIPDCADLDDDNDGYDDLIDAYPLDETEWLDTDNDGVGNNQDLDDDNDLQTDQDEISCGSNPLDVEDLSLDSDQDNIPDCVDNDQDADGVINEDDAFPLDASEWFDTDNDGIGDNTDPDDDNDGFTDVAEINCRANSLDAQDIPNDLDGDFIPDCIDLDIDDDGFTNTDEEACQSDSYNSQSIPNDLDGDSIPDCLDTDIDEDGCPNEDDDLPNDPFECDDFDGDGIGDNADNDDDGDGVNDLLDAFPFDATESKDTDGDGIGDNSDNDFNGDGFVDDILIPAEVFSPNGDGINDGWRIVNTDLFPNCEVWIYTRTGELVYNKKRYRNEWEGVLNGVNLPEASYIYMIDKEGDGIVDLQNWVYLTR